MRRLKLVERAVIEANNGGKRTHICIKEEFLKAQETWIHKK